MEVIFTNIRNKGELSPVGLACVCLQCSYAVLSGFISVVLLAATAGEEGDWVWTGHYSTLDGSRMFEAVMIRIKGQT